MTPHIPALLALLGTALMAVVIFAPRKPAPAGAAVSYAPPLAPPPVERWTPPQTGDAFEPVLEPIVERAPVKVSWPELVDPAAAGAAIETRVRMAEALGAVRGPWALAVLERARGEEPEPAVRAAIDAALP